MDIDELLVRLLVYGIYPLWLAAGAADWACHRATGIERTSGPHESVFHLLLIGTIAAPLSLGLFHEPNAGLLAFAAVCVGAHTALSLWDSFYTTPRRYISPLEQHVHTWLDSLPWFGLALVAVLHWDALREPVWWPVPRAEPLPRGAVSVALLALAGGAALVIEEWLRGVRFTRRRAASASSP